MANKYLLKPELKTAKQGYILEDEEGNVVYKCKMLKFKLFTASPFEFTNNLTNTTEEHKIGKTVTIEQGGNDLIAFLSKRSYFKYDGVKIWDYLHDKGIRIDSKPSSLNIGPEKAKLGMSYEVIFEGKPFATIETTSPKGKSIFTNDMYYNITCEEKDIDLAFLVGFAIAKTEQTFYN